MLCPRIRPRRTPPMSETEILSQFADPTLVASLLRELKPLVKRPLRLMEVCGTHTMALFETGLRPVLGRLGIELVSGPGCPVCVTAQEDLDHALHLAAAPGVIFCTFGDMMRVPGTRCSLSEMRAGGADVRVVYSPLDAVELARQVGERQVVFLAVGFETTAPAVAYALAEAKAQALANFLVYPCNKTIPAPLSLLAAEPGLDGFLCPGHVSVVIGARAYRPIAENWHKPCAIAGFEPVDILRAVIALARQVAEGRAEVHNAYSRVVREEGNPHALALINEVFEPQAALWRGLGEIPLSGLALRGEYRRFDARLRFPGFVPLPLSPRLASCRCGEVLAGRIRPDECECFGAACTPEDPLGACMVSQEGACRAFYRFRGWEAQ